MILLVILIFCSSAHAANWTEYETRSSNDTYYYDSTSTKIKKFSNGVKYIQVWEKTELESPRYTNRHLSNCGAYSSSLCNKPYISVKSISYYDCWGDKIGTGKSLYYNSKGEVVDQYDFSVNTNSSYSWWEVIPDSVGEGKLKEICRAYRNKLK